MNPPHNPAPELEREREAFISTADKLVPDDIKKLITEVERYAPPQPRMNSEITVSVEGSCYADSE